MTREEIRQAIEFFMDVVEGEYSVDERELNLYVALDRLAIAFHFANYNFDEADHPDALVRDYPTVMEIVSRNFPNLGLYNVVLDIDENIGEGERHRGQDVGSPLVLQGVVLLALGETLA
ncbi:MAG: hypothetical protein AB7V18_07520 [Pyrinomonadaceae bacterium]